MLLFETNGKPKCILMLIKIHHIVEELALT